MADSNILDIVPGIVADVAGPLLFRDAELYRTLPGTGPAHNPGQGSTPKWGCRALVTNWRDSTKAGGLVAAVDRKILILAETLEGTEPQNGDSVVIQGKTYRITADGGSQPAVTRDPARAVWVCRGRA